MNKSTNSTTPSAGEVMGHQDISQHWGNWASRERNFIHVQRQDVLPSQGPATLLGHKHVEECLFSMVHGIEKVGTKLNIH